MHLVTFKKVLRIIMKDMWGLTVRGICEYNGKILLLKLRSISAHDPGKWEIPGGKVKKNEFFDDALRREYLEETGLEIEIDSLYNAIQKNYTACKTGESIKSIQLIMKVSVKTDEVVISDEHAMYGWFTKEEIDDMIANNELTPPAINAFIG
jgi:8-oxo-dGTP diphosphatase